MTQLRRIMSTMTAGAVLGALVVSSAPAQDRTGIPIRKDQPVIERDTVNLTAIRVDTVTVERVVVRTDTVTVTVRDTVMQPAQPLDMANWEFYWGLGGGATVPSSSLDQQFNTGWNAALVAGWRGQTHPWGLRLEGAYNQLNGATLGGVEMDDASVWGAMADATFDIPFGMEQRTALYLLGGVGVHGFSGFDIDDEDIDEILDNDPEVDEQEIITESTTDFGVNAGAGVRFPVGSANLFLEGRWVRVFTDGNESDYFPLVLGFTF